mgnify:CR=1 FL=1
MMRKVLINKGRCLRNQGKDLKSFIPKDREVHIQAPKRKTKKSKRFSFLDEDIGVNE